MLSKRRVPAESIVLGAGSLLAFFLEDLNADLPDCFAVWVLLREGSLLSASSVLKNYLYLCSSSTDNSPGLSSTCWILLVKVMPWAVCLIQGASGMGASIYFRLNSLWIISSSTLGIMLGGLIKVMENEGRKRKDSGSFPF